MSHQHQLRKDPDLHQWFLQQFLPLRWFEKYQWMRANQQPMNVQIRSQKWRWVDHALQKERCNITRQAGARVERHQDMLVANINVGNDAEEILLPRYYVFSIAERYKCLFCALKFMIFLCFNIINLRVRSTFVNLNILL